MTKSDRLLLRALADLGLMACTLVAVESTTWSEPTKCGLAAFLAIAAILRVVRELERETPS